MAVLIDHGLGNRFPVPCISWRSANAKNRETTQKCICKGKLQVDEQLKNDQLSLENALAREMVRRILDACPYVVSSRLHLQNHDPNGCTVCSTWRNFFQRPKMQTLRMMVQVWCPHFCVSESNSQHQTLIAFQTSQSSQISRNSLMLPARKLWARWQILASSIQRNRFSSLKPSSVRIPIFLRMTRGVSWPSSKKLVIQGCLRLTLGNGRAPQKDHHCGFLFLHSSPSLSQKSRL